MSIPYKLSDINLYIKQILINELNNVVAITWTADDDVKLNVNHLNLYPGPYPLRHNVADKLQRSALLETVSPSCATAYELFCMEIPCHVCPWSETFRAPKEVLVGCLYAVNIEERRCFLESIEEEGRPQD